MPTIVLELSSVILGVVGACLVQLSNAFLQRVRAAFWICLALLLVRFAKAPPALHDATLLQAIIDSQDDSDAGFIFTGDMQEHAREGVLDWTIR